MSCALGGGLRAEQTNRGLVHCKGSHYRFHFKECVPAASHPSRGVVTRRIGPCTSPLPLLPPVSKYTSDASPACCPHRRSPACGGAVCDPQPSTAVRPHRCVLHLGPGTLSLAFIGVSLSGCRCSCRQRTFSDESSSQRAGLGVRHQGGCAAASPCMRSPIPARTRGSQSHGVASHPHPLALPTSVCVLTTASACLRV